MSKDDFGGAVYRLYDADDNLIYIGSTGDPVTRIRQHQKGSVVGTPTAQQIRERYHRHEFTFYPTLVEARAAEAVAIRKEAPELNRQHAGPWRGLPECASEFRGIGIAFADLAAEREMGLAEVAAAMGMTMHIFLTKMRGDSFSLSHILAAAMLFGVPASAVAERLEDIEAAA